MVSSDTASNLARTFVMLNDRVLGGDTWADALQRLVELAAHLVPGCEWAAVTVWPLRDRPYSPATSDGIAAAVDQLQYDAGDGPCLTAAAERAVVCSPDLNTEGRWPRFTTATLRRSPVRGVMSFHLAHRPARTALNLYSSMPGAFDSASLGTATLFATHASVLLQHADAADLTVSLSKALLTSRVIGAAVGILMNEYKITEDQAFGLLRVHSQRLNRKLSDIAEDVTQTGTLPDPQ